MADFAKLRAAVARLEANDTAALAMLKDTRDQSVQLADRLDNVSKQLAELQKAGTDTAAIQGEIDKVADDLNAHASEIEEAIKKNPNTPDLPPPATADQPVEQKAG